MKTFQLQDFRDWEPTPVAVRSKAQVCSFLIAWFAGSNPPEGFDVRLLFLFCDM